MEAVVAPEVAEVAPLEAEVALSVLVGEEVEEDHLEAEEVEAARLEEEVTLVVEAEAVLLEGEEEDVFNAM